ncbi:MAG: RnfABCDGE type electron transport complex subunit D [Raoultibacter sp.]
MQKTDSLLLSTAPHIVDTTSTPTIMRNVIIALVPTLIASAVLFGWRAMAVVAVCVLSCVVFEYAWCVLRKQPQTTKDFSAVVTGLLLAFNLPSTIPLYMPIIGSFVAIIMVKELFGGLGYNFANPAVVARIVLSVSFTSSMTSFAAPHLLPTLDAVSSATPLATGAETTPLFNLFFGIHAGALGETCAFTLLLGFAWLIITRTISPAIPVVYVATVAALSALFGHDVLSQVFSGGLLLGAIFMATDYVTSPTTLKGKVVFAVGLGIITCTIRFWGNMNEGVAYAILLMNLLVPYINSLTRTLPLGAQKKHLRRKGASQ